MHLTTLWQVIGWLALPLLALLAGILVCRRVHREFPYFFYYVVVGELVGLARLLAYYETPQYYFEIYWILDAIDTVFAFLATYELCLRRLFPQFFRIRFYRYLFPPVILIAIVFAVPALLYSHRLKMLVTIINAFDFVRVAALFFFVVLMSFMGRHWNKYEFGIALGFGVQGAALLPAFAAWTRITGIHNFLEQLPVIGYDIACLIWLVYFFQSTPPIPSESFANPELVQDAQQTEEELKQWLVGRKRSQ